MRFTEAFPDRNSIIKKVKLVESRFKDKLSGIDRVTGVPYFRENGRIHLFGNKINAIINENIIEIFKDHDNRKREVLMYDGQLNEAFGSAPGKVNSYDDLEKKIEFFINSPSRYSLMVIAGKPGTGKSTAIKKVASKVGEFHQVLPAAKGFTKEDGEDIDMKYRQFISSTEEEKVKMTENIMEKANETDFKRYNEIKDKLEKLDSNSEEYVKLKTERKDMLNRYAPRSLTAKLRASGNTIMPYDKKIYAGSQNVNKKQFFMELWRANGSVIIYDDSNISFWNDEGLQDLLLHASQTEKVKTISFPESEEGFIKTNKGNYIPDRFYYTGKIIIITNRNIKDLPQNVQSRIAIPVNFNPTSQEIFDQTERELDRLKEEFKDEFSEEEIMDVYLWLKRAISTKSIKYDLRLFSKLLLWRSQHPDPVEFDREAKRMVRDFYAREKDEKAAMKVARIRNIVKSYINSRGQLKKSQRDRVNKFLKYLPDDEINSGNIFAKIDNLLGINHAP